MTAVLAGLFIGVLTVGLVGLLLVPRLRWLDEQSHRNVALLVVLSLLVLLGSATARSAARDLDTKAERTRRNLYAWMSEVADGYGETNSAIAQGRTPVFDTLGGGDPSYVREANGGGYVAGRTVQVLWFQRCVLGSRDASGRVEVSAKRGRCASAS